MLTFSKSYRMYGKPVPALMAMPSPCCCVAAVARAVLQGRNGITATLGVAQGTRTGVEKKDRKSFRDDTAAAALTTDNLQEDGVWFEKTWTTMPAREKAFFGCLASLERSTLRWNSDLVFWDG